MKKSTIIIILIVYLASIIAIGFFGMSLKIYGTDIKYVKTIEMTAEAENDNMFEFTQTESSAGYIEYELVVNFEEEALTGAFEEDGATVMKRYLPLNLIPKVTYQTGDVEGEAEKIVFSTNEQAAKHINAGKFKLEQNGTLMFFASGYSFKIYVRPAAKSGAGTEVVITVDVE